MALRDSLCSLHGPFYPDRLGLGKLSGAKYPGLAGPKCQGLTHARRSLLPKLLGWLWRGKDWEWIFQIDQRSRVLDFGVMEMPVIGHEKITIILCKSCHILPLR